MTFFRLFVIWLVCFFLIVVLCFVYLQPAEASLDPKTEPMDRIPVTGCPYGDSIPLEYCDKFADPQPEVFYEDSSGK